MTPEELAQSVERLRELDANRPKQPVKFSVELKQPWDKAACDAFDIAMERSVKYSESMQTINAIVELVGEMREDLEYGVRYSKIGFPVLTVMPPIHTQTEFEHRANKTLTKAAPIVKLARGE